jgi:hypothetical protein
MTQKKGETTRKGETINSSLPSPTQLHLCFKEMSAGLMRTVDYYILMHKQPICFLCREQANKN